MKDQTGVTLYAYDDLYRLSGVTDPGGRKVGYEYDQTGAVTAVTYPEGQATRCGYDSLGRLETVYSPKQELKLIAEGADKAIPGKGAVIGTRKHTLFEKGIKALKNQNLDTEVAMMGGREVARGTKGSVRLDVIERAASGVIGTVYDLKTGGGHPNSPEDKADSGGSGIRSRRYRDQVERRLRIDGFP